MASEEAQETPHERTPFGLLSRTWELELFISGALVFALMQLPGHVDALWDRVAFELGPTTFGITLLAYIYARAIVNVLIVAFLLNLGARAFWVGLVGLHSVYPDGIRWERTKAGPIQRTIYDRRVPGTSRMIALLDNFCSITFSFAFVLVVLFVFSTLLLGSIGVGVLLAMRALGRPELAPRVTLVAMLVVGALIAGIALLDRHYGARLEGTRRGAALYRALDAITIFQALPLWGSTFMTLVTNLRARVMLPILYLVMLGVIFAVFVDLIGDGAEITGNPFTPAHAGVVGVDYGHYQNHWPDDARATLTPSIQADIIRDPVVRLFIPFNARRDGPAIERLCPDARPLVDGAFTMNALREPVPEPARVDAILGCIASYRNITLNGAPLGQDADVLFYEEPRFGQDGAVVYIPVAHLPAGQHVLSVERTPRWEDDAAPGDPPREPQPPYTIRFWR